MKQVRIILLGLLVGLMVLGSGCFWDDDNDYNGYTGGSRVINNSEGTAILGNLSDATVEIYEIGSDGRKILKWTEKTSGGNSLLAIGKFNTHSGEMKADKFYLFKISGGIDWDKDDDGVYDPEDSDPNCPNGTPNKGTIRAILKGADVKEIGNNLTVTAISEMVYEKVGRDIGKGFTPKKFEKKLKDAVSQIIEDIDGDGEVDVFDMAKFHPVKNFHENNKLKDFYKDRYRKITNVIHQGAPVQGSFNSQIFSLSSAKEITRIAILPDETKACFVTRENDMRIIKIVDLTPTTPELLGTGVTMGILGISDPADSYSYINITRVRITNSYLFVLEQNRGLYIVDISNPSNPVRKSHFDFSTELGTNDHYFSDIVISSDKNMVFVVGEVAGGEVNEYKGFVFCVDISDVEHPSVKNEFINGDSKLGGFDLTSYIISVELSDSENKLYFLDRDKKLIVADVSGNNLTNFQKYDLNIDFHNKEDTYLDVNNHIFYFKPVGGKDSFISVLDISDLDNVRKLPSLDLTPDKSVRCFIVTNDKRKIYIADNNDYSFKLIDLMAEEKNFIEVDCIFTSEGSSLIKCAEVSYQKDKLAILLCNGGEKKLKIFNISNYPFTVEGTFELEEPDFGKKALYLYSSHNYSIKFSKDGKKVYVVDDDLIYALDISDLNNIQQITTFSGCAVIGTLSGNKLCILNGSEFQLKDIANNYNDISSSALESLNVNCNCSDDMDEKELGDLNDNGEILIMKALGKSGDFYLKCLNFNSGEIKSFTKSLDIGVMRGKTFFPDSKKVLILHENYDSEEDEYKFKLETYGFTGETGDLLGKLSSSQLDFSADEVNSLSSIVVSSDYKKIYFFRRNGEIKIVDISDLNNAKNLYSLYLKNFYSDPRILTKSVFGGVFVTDEKRKNLYYLKNIDYLD